MAEVKVTQLFKVQMTEYERGWGQRDMGTKFFDNELEAKRFCDEYNKDAGDPDCYYRASYSKVA
jgi:hypothetical protein